MTKVTKRKDISAKRFVNSWTFHRPTA